MTRYAIGLGSNLGDRLAHLRGAVSGLRRIGEVVAVSPLYETAPIGGPEQGPYLNAVVVVESDLEPHDLLAACNRLETAAGRTRRERWGPRTLDLDIVASDGPHTSSERLEVPHPRARQRRFVLQPLADVWPEAEVGAGITASQALAGLDDQDVALFGADWLQTGP